MKTKLAKEREELYKKLTKNTIVFITGGRCKGKIGKIVQVRKIKNNEYRGNGYKYSIIYKYNSYFSVRIMIDNKEKTISCNNIKISGGIEQ